ncbi:MAG TPA: DUF1552 domain-containing protein [Planctomycetota bacterium]|nr:DUF1552 domain-containing protein [Planctomycetota bacterium]
MTISRRNMLRGMGAALALPWLEALSNKAHAGEKLEKPPLRTAFFFMPNGVNPANFTPKGTGEQYELSPMLKSLEKVKGDIVLVENCFHAKTDGRNGHWPKVPAWLHGGFVVRTSGRDLDVGGTSADQILAQAIGDRTPLPSFELGVDPTRSGVDNAGGGFAKIYGSHIAWRDPHTPVPKEIIPQLAFDRLFRTASAAPVVSGFNPNQPAVIKSLQRDDTSVLDLVLEDAKSLRGKVSANDAVKLDEYLESVRSVERRIENTLKPQKRWINEGRFDLPRPGPGIPETHEEHLGLMMDILVLAFWTDSTRIATMMMGDAQSGRGFSFLDGVNGSWHGLSHHRNEVKTLAQYEKIATWHIERFAKVLERLKGLDEGGTPLLDNCQILWGCTIRDGNKHDHRNLPALLCGKAQGKIRTGRRLTCEPNTPMNNLLLSMLQNAGVDLPKFGDSTGVVKLA